MLMDKSEMLLHASLLERMGAGHAVAFLTTLLDLLILFGNDFPLFGRNNADQFASNNPLFLINEVLCEYVCGHNVNITIAQIRVIFGCLENPLK